GLNGVAAGGAVSLALACDIIVARRSARFVSAFSRIGLLPDCGGSWLYIQAFGLHRAKAFAMLEQEISAEQAHGLGVVAKLTEEHDFKEVLQETATHFVLASPDAMRITKHALNAATINDLPTQLGLERKWQNSAANGNDFQEGITAFRDRRKPDFGAKPEENRGK
ncbi:MAG: enoyl-CoA hydratase-related protein, partial [Rhizobiaceae bacterium]